jgi:hypothetical protein
VHSSADVLPRCLPYPSLFDIVQALRMEWSTITSSRRSLSKLQAGGFVHVPMDAASRQLNGR